jgi:hypothetical protein
MPAKLPVPDRRKAGREKQDEKSRTRKAGQTDSVSERNCFTIEALGQEWLSRNAIAGSRATVYGEFELLARC